MKLNTAITLTIALGGVIAYGTLSSPGSGGSSMPLNDKLIHFLAFAVLVLPLGWARPTWLLWVAAVALAYGAAIEVIQPHVGRSGEWGDLMADGLGILAGVIPGLLKQRYQTAQR